MRDILLLALIIILAACQTNVAQPLLLTPTPVKAIQSTATPEPSPAATETITPPATLPPVASPQPTPESIDNSTSIFSYEVGAVLLEKVNSVAVANGLAYVITQTGLHLFDISNPAAPDQIGLYSVQWPQQVVVAEQMAYVIAGGLHLVDVSEPTVPGQVGFYQPPAGIYGMAATGETVYLITGPDLLIVDVSNPAMPRELGQISTEWVSRVVIAGTTAYLIGGVDDTKLYLFDISSPSAPRQMSLYQTSTSITDVAIDPTAALAYVIDRQGLQILDISDPTEPKEIGDHTLSGGDLSLVVAGDTLYIAGQGVNGQSGLSVIDVSDPIAPREIGFVKALDGWWDSEIAVYEAADQVDVYVLAYPGGPLLAFSDIQTTLSQPFAPATPTPIPVTPVELPSPEQETVWTYYPLPRDFNFLWSILLDPGGRIWGTHPGGIIILEIDDSAGTATWTPYKPVDLPNTQYLRPLAIDGEGRIWVSISLFNGQNWSDGIAVFDKVAWTIYTSADGLTGGIVYDTVVDEAGQVWAGTEEGLSKFDGQTWTRIEGAPAPARAIAFDQAGLLWVGSNLGVSVFDGLTWTTYPKADNFELHFVNDIAFDPEGNVWIATGSGGSAPGECSNTGLSKFDGRTWTNYLQTFLRNFCNDGPVTAIAFDQAGNGWAGMNSNVKKFDPKTVPAGATLYDEAVWTEYYDDDYDRAASGSGGPIIIDQAGNIWFKGLHGVSRLQTLPLAVLAVESPKTYTDPDLDFSLNYDPSWQLETRTGTDLNDGSGRTILLEKEGYQFKLQFQRKPEVAGECGGILTQADLTRYWKYPLGQLEVWRAKAEAGWVNSYHDDRISFIDIIVPTELWDETDARGEIGVFSCSPQINDYLVNISYQLPVSVENLKAGRFKPERLAEMDYILTSLTWK